jgi:hypothetical protein
MRNENTIASIAQRRLQLLDTHWYKIIEQLFNLANVRETLRLALIGPVYARAQLLERYIRDVER